jgi:hypothetical protein
MLHNLRSRKDVEETKIHVYGGHNLYTTFQVHTKHSIWDTENWFALLERTTHLVQYTLMWAPFVARRMSKRYSTSRHVFSSIWGVRETTALLIRARSSTTLPTFGRNVGPLHSPRRKTQWGYIGGLSGPRDWPVPLNPTVCNTFIQRISQCKAHAWRDTILLKGNV